MLFWERKTLWQRFICRVPWQYSIACYSFIVVGAFLLWGNLVYLPLHKQIVQLQQELEDSLSTNNDFSKQSLQQSEQSQIFTLLKDKKNYSITYLLTCIQQQGCKIIQKISKKRESFPGYCRYDAVLQLCGSYEQITNMFRALILLSNVIIKNFKLDNPKNGEICCSLGVRVLIVSTTERILE